MSIMDPVKSRIALTDGGSSVSDRPPCVCHLLIAKTFLHFHHPTCRLQGYASAPALRLRDKGATYAKSIDLRVDLSVGRRSWTCPCDCSRMQHPAPCRLPGRVYVSRFQSCVFLSPFPFSGNGTVRGEELRAVLGVQGACPLAHSNCNAIGRSESSLLPFVFLNFAKSPSSSCSLGFVR